MHVSQVPDEGPELDARRVFEALDRFGVEYLVIGGMATRLYGASRLTKDIDVLHDLRAADGRRKGFDELAGSQRAAGADTFHAKPVARPGRSAP